MLGVLSIGEQSYDGQRVRRLSLNPAYDSSTEVTDGRDRKEGVIRRYYVSDEYGAPLAIIETRSCFDQSHV